MRALFNMDRRRLSFILTASILEQDDNLEAHFPEARFLDDSEEFAPDSDAVHGEAEVSNYGIYSITRVKPADPSQCLCQ